MKIVFTALMMLAITVSAQERPHEEQAAQPTELFVLTLFPEFLELVEPFNTKDECVARGVEFVTTTDVYNGFICERGRAWQKDMR